MIPTTTATTPEKVARYDRETRDFWLYLDGEFIGCAPTQFEANLRLNEAAWLKAEHAGRCVTAEAAAEAELIEQERQAGVAEAQPVATAEIRPTVTIAPIAQAVRALPITAQDIADTIDRARNYAATERQVKALNKALEELLIPRNFQWDGDRLITGSRSKPKDRHYVTAEACDCDGYIKSHGTQPCWHRLAYDVLAELTMRAAAAARLAEQGALYAALQSPGAAETSDLSPLEAREILASRYVRA